MAKVRAQIITRRASDLPRDFIVNTVHFDIDGIWNWPEGVDAQAIANDIRDMWANGRQYVPEGYGVEVNIYNLEDELPRAVMAHASYAAYSQASGASGPREVALCLSFYSERNIPRRRGRLFIGPWTQGTCAERPEAGPRANLLNLAGGLADIGGINVDWSVRSKFPIALGDQGGTLHKISNSWVDNEWDTIRKRGLRGSSRDTATHDE